MSFRFSRKWNRTIMNRYSDYAYKYHLEHCSKEDSTNEDKRKNWYLNVAGLTLMLELTNEINKVRAFKRFRRKCNNKKLGLKYYKKLEE